MLHHRNRVFALSGFVVAVLGLAPASLASGQPAPVGNPFAGSWAGTFTSSLGGFGVIEVDVSSGGQIRGWLENHSNGDVADVVGHVNRKGFGHANTMNPPDFSHPFNLWASIDDEGRLIVIAQSLINDELVIENVFTRQ